MPKTKSEFVEGLKQAFQENIWKEEIQSMGLDELLGSLRTQLAQAEIKLEAGEYNSKNEGKKEIERLQADVESTQAAIARTDEQKVFWEKRLDLVNRYGEKNGVESST